MKHTEENPLIEILTYGRSVLLQVSWIVVVGTVLALLLEGVGVLDHLLVQGVEGAMRDGAFHHDETIVVEASEGGLKVLGT